MKRYVALPVGQVQLYVLFCYWPYLHSVVDIIQNNVSSRRNLILLQNSQQALPLSITGFPISADEAQHQGNTPFW